MAAIDRTIRGADFDPIDLKQMIGPVPHRLLNLRANARLGMDFAAAGPTEGIALQVVRLLLSRDSGVADLSSLLVSKPGDECKQQNLDCESRF